MKAREILKVKGDILYTIKPSASMSEALDFMHQEDIGSLVVMEFGELVGMLTFREMITAMSELQTSSENLQNVLSTVTVRKYMDAHPMTVTPDTDVNEVRRMMIEAHCRYLPVLSAKTLVGIISFYDVARAVLDAQAVENKLLKAYIRDWPTEEKA